ncbi:MAG: hypothetical protein U0L76_00905 [Ruminococcus sp.]|nr:hypothetical protein [Ruminococcus sp.]
MVIYQMKKPVESLTSDCVGVTGDNLAHTQEFYIKDVSDDTLSYTLHLRFADGSVNSVTPDYVQNDGEGTGIRWVVKQNDIFMHGYFELQIEGRNEDGFVFQTEIIRLYADESIPVEDKEYENPNSATLQLRDEAYELLSQITEQQNQIEENLALIEQTDLSSKLDDAKGVITTNHIANGAVTSIKIADNAIASSQIISGAVSLDKLSADAQNTISAKADKTELEAYEKSDNKIYTEEDITDVDLNYPSVLYLDEYYYKFNETDELLAEKYDSSNIETGSGTLTANDANTDKINSAQFEYQKIGDQVNLHIYVDFKAFTPTSSSQSITLSGLPFVCKNSVTPREMCVTTAKKQMLWGIVPNSAGLTLLLFSASAFTENEKLSFSLRYRIS